MFETPEKSERSGSVKYLKRWKKARKDLLDRADQLKGKDEKRRKSLTQAAKSMVTGKTMTGEQIRRAALLGELDLLIDKDKHTGK